MKKRLILVVFLLFPLTAFAAGAPVHTSKEREYADFDKHLGDLIKKNNANAASNELQQAINNHRFPETYTTRLYESLAVLHIYHLHQPKEAEEYYSLGLKSIADNDPNADVTRMRILFDLGNLQDNLGKSAEGAESLLTARDIAKKIHDEKMVQSTLHEIVLLYANLNDEMQTRKYYEQLKALPNRKTPKTVQESMHENNYLAVVEIALKQYDQALEHAKTAASQVILAGDNTDKAAIYDTVAMAYVANKQYDLALPYTEYALSQYNEWPLSKAEELKTYGNVLLGLGRNAEACKAWSDAAVSYVSAENRRKQEEMQRRIDENCR